MALQEVKEPVVKVTTIQDRQVDDSAPTDKQALVWNNSTQKWEPAEPYAVYG
jgi:hypothetical protein